MSTWQRRSGIMLAYPFDQERLTGSKSGRKTQWQKPWLVQPKFNGERVRAEVYKKNACLWSSEENVINSLPHINRFLESLNLDFDFELDSEGYRHGMSKQDIGSIIGRTKNIHPNHEVIQLHAFDLITDAPQLQRIEWLFKICQAMGAQDLIVPCPTDCVTDMDKLGQLLMYWIDQRYEGIIVREPGETYQTKRVTSMMKWKPRKSDSYLIVGYSEECDVEGEPKDTLGSFLCQDDRGEQFNVGSGTYFTASRRQELWDRRNTLPGMYASVKYPELTNRGIPNHPVIFDLTIHRIDYDEEVI
jgi:ATP-dependent DNA ligase